MVHFFEKVKSVLFSYLSKGIEPVANIYFNEQKAPKQQAINNLLVHISNYFDGRYEVLAASDDGGTHLEIQVEVGDVNATIESQNSSFPFFDVWPKWEGWRTVVVKVPTTYIDTITNGVELDDY
jgi:hypothetical protein